MDSPRCWIHTANSNLDIHDQLQTPKDIESWNILVEAARIRNVPEVFELAATHEGVIPNIYYHSYCRKIFTMKSTLNRLASSQASSEACEDMEIGETIAKTKSKRQHSSGASALLDDSCLFCCKKSKYAKCSNSREALILCTEMHVDYKIREYAERTSNKRLLGIVSCYELVAAEAKYHASCYRASMDELKKLQRQATIKDVEVDDAHTKTFSDLVLGIHTILDKPCVTSMTDLTQYFVNQLFHGETCVRESLKKNLKRKIENYFDDDLHFVQGMYYPPLQHIRTSRLVIVTIPFPKNLV